MDGLAFASVDILVHNGYDWTFLGGAHSSCCDDGDLVDPVVVNTSNVHTSVGHGYDSDIISSNPPICSTVN